LQGNVTSAILQGSVFTGSLLYYAHFWEDPKLVEDRFGAILTVLMLLLLASPLLSLVMYFEKIQTLYGYK
jgi:hypothetical protein